MTRLNDKDIRPSLIQKLKNQSIKPRAVLEELHVHNGNAIADVVALYNDAHCFEIKGDGDKIERIIDQGYFYNLSFRKITLVTTRKHLEKALSIAPYYWGIMVAEESNNNICINYARAAQYNPNFHKSIALLTLWKNEMLNLLDKKNRHKTKNRAFLAKLISQSQRKDELSKNICSSLLSRYEDVLA